MLSCLNRVTTGGAPTLEDFLNAASRVGFQAVEYGPQAFADVAREKSLDAAREMLESRKLVWAASGLPVQWRKDEEKFRAGLKKLPELAKVSTALGCTRWATYLPPSIDEDVASYTCRAARRLRECAKILNDFGISFGLEWVGPKTSRTAKHDFIHTMQGALELGQAIGTPNMGILLDSFHYYTTRLKPEDIEELPLEKIVHVHVNDAPDKPVDEQIDNQRLLPGEGIIGLVGMLGVLKRKGYRGPLSVETFSQTLPKLGLQVAAERAKRALDSVLSKLP